MTERRRDFRFVPKSEDEERVTLQDIDDVAVVADYSASGICVILLRGAELRLGQVVTVDFRGRQRQAIVRNLTYDTVTVGCGLQWAEPDRELPPMTLVADG